MQLRSDARFATVRRSMRRFATWTTGHRKTVIIGWIVALIGIGFISGSVGSDFTEEFKLPSSDSKEAFDLLEDRFPPQSGDTRDDRLQGAGRGRLAGGPNGRWKASSPRSRKAAARQRSRQPLRGQAAPGRSARTAKIAYATVQFDVANDKLEKDNIERGDRDRARRPTATASRSQLGGSADRGSAQQEEGGDSSFAIGLLAAVVILLLTFGSVVAMGLPMLTALFALGVGISLVTLGTHVFDTANFAPQLAAMIGLGVGIDYALFILTRFRNGLDEGLEPRDAAIAAVDTAGRAVLFAGITVIISLMGMLLLGISFLYGVAIAAALAVLFTMIAALTLLPALLTIAGKPGRPAAHPRARQARSTSAPKTRRWFRWSREIQRRPVLSALLSGGLLLLLCVPTLSLRLGSNDAGTDPAGTTTRKAYDLLAEGFGPGFNGPFRSSRHCRARAKTRRWSQLRKTLEERRRRRRRSTPMALNPAKNTGVFQVYPTTSPQSDETTKLLDHIRDDVIPPIEQQTGAQLHVGGITAIFEDFGNAIAEKLPLFIGVVVLLSALLLMAVFRSVLVPLKAMVMNLLSIGAAFGLIVAVFQWGWGASLIGIDGTGPIVSFFPVFLFAIVFGLSMDYEVFLMSRIHEEWESQPRRDRSPSPAASP